MNEKELQALYNAMSSKFDVGDYNTFKSKMQTTNDRKSFFDAVNSKGVDLGDYNSYEKRLGSEPTPKPTIEEQKIAPTVTNLFGGITGAEPQKTPKQPTKKPKFSEGDGYIIAPTEEGSLRYQRQIAAPPKPKEKKVQVFIDKNYGKPTGDIQSEFGLLSGDEKLKREQQKEEYPQRLNEALNDTAEKILQQKWISPDNKLAYNQTVNDLKKKHDNGDLGITYDPKTGRHGFTQIEGAVDSFFSGINDAEKAKDEAEDFMHNMDTNKRVEYANKVLYGIGAEKSPYLGKQPSAAGGITGFVGENLPMLAKMGAAATVTAGIVGSLPETGGYSLAAAPTVAAILSTQGDMMNQGGQEEVLRRYKILKDENPDIPDAVLMDKAYSSGAPIGYLTGGLTNVALGAEGGHVFKNSLTKGAKEVLENALKNTANTSIKMGAVGGTAKATNIVEGALEGYKVTPEEAMKEVKNSAIGGMKTGAALALSMASIHGLVTLPNLLKSALKYGITKSSSIPEIQQALGEKEQSGQIPEGTTEKMVTDLQQYKDALDKIPENLDEKVKASVAGLIQKRDNIVAEQQTKDVTAQPLYDEEIKAVNNQIENILKTGKVEENEINEITGEPYKIPEAPKVEGKPEEISQPIELSTEVTEPTKDVNALLEEAKSSGKLGVFKDIPNDEVIKIVAQQAQDLDANGKPFEGEGAEQRKESVYNSTVNQFGKELTDAAIEKYNAEQPTSETNKHISEVKPTTKEQGIKEPISEGTIGVGKGTTEGESSVLNNKDIEESKNKMDAFSSAISDIDNHIRKHEDYPNYYQYKNPLDNEWHGKFKTKKETISNLDSGYKQWKDIYEYQLKKRTTEVTPTVLEVPEKAFTVNALKRADAKKVFAEYRKIVGEIPPMDARSIALDYFANGGTIGEKAVNEISGTVKRARLNKGRELKTNEAKARDYYDVKNEESLDQISHNLWENSNQEISEQDIKNELMDIANTHNTRLDIAKEYVSKYASEETERKHYQQFAEEHKAEIDAEEEALNKWLNGESELEFKDDETTFINDLINQNEKEQQPAGENKQPSPKTESGTNKKISSTEGTEQVKPKVIEKEQKPIIKANEGVPSGNEPITTEETGIAKENVGEVVPTPKEAITELYDKAQSKKGLAKENAMKLVEEEANKYGEEGKGILDELQSGGSKVIHAETAEIRKEFGLPEYEKQKATEEEWKAEADKRIKEGGMSKLLKKLENNETPSDVEQVMLGKYIKTLEEKASNTKSDEDISKLHEAIKLSDRIGGSEVGKSLRARQIVQIPDESLGAYFVREMESSKVDKLTEEQKDKVLKEYTDIQAKKEQALKDLKELEDAATKLRAENEVAKLAKEKKKPSGEKRNFKAERETLKDKLKKQVEEYKASAQKMGITSDGGAEGFIITAKMAKTIGEIVKSHVEEVGAKLAEVTKRTFEDVKDLFDGITEKDIHDIIAGKYKEPQKTKNQLMADLRDVRDEAALITKLEKLQNGEEPKEPKAKVKRNQQITELRNKIKEFRKEKENAEKEPKPQKESKIQKSAEERALEVIKSRNESQLKKINEQLASGNFEKEEKTPILHDRDIEKKYPELYKAAVKSRDELIKARQEREIRIIQQEYANRTPAQKTGDFALELLNMPRTLMSSMDYSAPLRQGLWAGVSHPTVAMKAGIEMFKQSLSQKRFDRWFHDVRESNRWNTIEEAGLYVADPHDIRLSAKEEQFMNNLAEKIPVFGKLIKGSERAYVGFLNKMRVDLFNRFVDAAEANGKTIQNSKDEYKRMAEYINSSTGRGSIGKIESAAPILNGLFFSPRLIASRLNLLTMPFNPKTYSKASASVRKAYFTDLMKMVGVGMSVMALAKLNGATVEDDPRSSDFGKIKSGNTRWDIWGGFQQYIRVISQLATGQSKSTNTGKIKEIDGTGAFGTSRGETALRFLRGKLAPVPSIAYDIASKRTANGEPVTWLGEAKSHLMPLSVSDIKEAVKDKGVSALFTVGVPTVFGVGVQTYTPNSKPDLLLNETEIKNPVFKKFTDKNVEFPNIGEKRIEIKDEKTNTIKKLSDYSQDKIKEFSDVKKSEFTKLIKQTNFVYINRYGEVSLNEPKDGKYERKPISKLDTKQAQKVIGEINTLSTKEAKKKIFNQ